MMLNRVVIIGRLTQDPEVRYTNSGTAVASFTLAVDRPKQKNGEKQTDFISVVTWSKLAELCSEYLKKGRLAAVDGRLQIRSYENKEGQKVRVAEVWAESVQFLDRGESAPDQQVSKPTKPSIIEEYGEDPFAPDDNLPF